MNKYCRTCHKPKELTAFWLAPASGRAKMSPPALSCIQCHQEGRVKHGYGPGCRWQTPMELDAWLAVR